MRSLHDRTQSKKDDIAFWWKQKKAQHVHKKPRSTVYLTATCAPCLQHRTPVVSLPNKKSKKPFSQHKQILSCKMCFVFCFFILHKPRCGFCFYVLKAKQHKWTQDSGQKIVIRSTCLTQTCEATVLLLVLVGATMPASRVGLSQLG